MFDFCQKREVSNNFKMYTLLGTMPVAMGSGWIDLVESLSGPIFKRGRYIILDKSAKYKNIFLNYFCRFRIYVPENVKKAL